MALGSLRFEGLSTGLDYTKIIQELTKFKRAPISKIQGKIQKETTTKTALLSINAQLLAFQSKLALMGKPSTFAATNVTSSNDKVIRTTGSLVSTTGSLQLTVDKVATTHQIVSNGFINPDDRVTTTSGVITVEVGGGYVSRETPLSFLRGQNGIDKGKIKITDKNGDSSIINLVGALTVKDVIDKINNDSGISVRASVQSDRIVIEDTSGGSGSLRIEDIGTTTVAADLGISETSSSGIIYGSDVSYLTSGTSLSLLNDNLGIRHNGVGTNDFRITDTDGTSFTVDISSSIDTVGEVLQAIGSAAAGAGSSLRARLSEDRTRIVLFDSIGSQSITVSAVSSSVAAVDLGFGYASGTSFAQFSTETVTGVENRLVGSRVIPSLNSTLRNLLNGGQNFVSSDSKKGISDGTIFVRDRQGDATTINISKRFSTSATVSSTTRIAVSSTDGIAAGNKIRFYDSTGTTYYRTVTKVSGTAVFFDEVIPSGLVGSAVTVKAEIDNVNDMLNLLNRKASAASVGVTFRLNPMENGFMAVDTTSGSSASLKVSGTSSGDLGLKSTSSTNKLIGSDVDPQYIGHSTRLATLNSGDGVRAGKIKITDTVGKSFTVDLSQSTDDTIGEVIDEINNGAIAAGSALRARINNTGDGIVLEDSAAGGAAITVAEVDGGTTARDLNLLGTASSTSLATLDGSFEKTIKIDGNSTYKELAAQINSAGAPIFASIINTFDAANPYKISIISKKSGAGGRIVLDGTISGLEFETSSEAQNSVVFVGADVNGVKPLVIASPKNTITGLVSGLTLELLSESQSPVTVTMTKDLDSIANQFKSVIDGYNDLQKKITELSNFDQSTFERGPLFADSTARAIKSMLAVALNRPVSGVSSSLVNTFAEIGGKVVAGGMISLNEGTFMQKLTNNFEEVEKFFSSQRKITLDTPLKHFRSGEGIDTIEGTDFKIFLRDAGLTVSVNVDGSETVNSLLGKINFAKLNDGTANNNRLVAEIDPTGFSLRLSDNSVSSKTVDSVDGGSPKQIFTDAALANRDGAGVIGATVTFTSGPNSGQSRTVAGYASSTGQITLESALTNNITVGDTFTITRKIEVRSVSNSAAASQLGILGSVNSINDLILKGKTQNLRGDPGFSFMMNDVVNLFVDTVDGSLTKRLKSIDSKVESLNKDIKDIEKLVAREEERLIRQFTALEKAISKSQSTSARLNTLLSAVSSGASAFGSLGSLIGLRR